MCVKTNTNNKNITGKTPNGTKIEVIGQCVDENGNTLLYDVIKPNNPDLIYQIRAEDLILNEN